MGSDKDKLEKKRLKAQIKLEKKRAKHADEQDDEQVQTKTAAKQQTKTEDIGTKVESVGGGAAPSVNTNLPWYKNPDWLRAIAGIASLVVATIALILAFYR